MEKKGTSKVEVPDHHRSQRPELLRDLAIRLGKALAPADVELILSAAAEIEGSEEAFGAVVEQLQLLKRDLANKDKNLQAAYDLIRVQSNEARVL